MTAYMPPLVIDVRVGGDVEKGRRIWFPFFLLWPLLIIVVAFALLVTMLVDFALMLAGARYHYYTLLLIGAVRLLGGVRGTRVRAGDGEARINVHIL